MRAKEDALRCPRARKLWLLAHPTALLLHRDCKTDSQDTDHSKDWFQISLGCVPRFFCGNQKGERTMLLSRGYLTVQCVMHGAPAPTGVLPSELSVSTCFDGIRTNMSRKGPFECQTDSPRRPHLRPRKGTNLGAGNPSPASCSASSRCQPCAPLARLKKYFQSFRANPFNQHTSAGSSMSARSTWRSLGVDFTPSEARSGEVEGGEVDLGLLRSPVPG